MGICGVDYEGGVLWKRVKEKAMAEDAPDDQIIVRLQTNLTCFYTDWFYYWRTIANLRIGITRKSEESC